MVPAHGTQIFTAKTKKRIDRTVYEAETAYMRKYQELRNNQSEKSAIYRAMDGAMGGYVAGFLGQGAANDIVWNDVYVEKEGTRRVTFQFYCAEDRDMDLEVNGKFQTTLRTHSRNWNMPARITVSVPLRKGSNTIRLSNSNDWMPDIDCMIVKPLGVK